MAGNNVRASWGRSSKKRQPFKGRSLPQPGESLQDRALDLFFGLPFILATMSIVLTAVAATELLVQWQGWKHSPWTWLGFAALTGALAAWRFYRVWPELLNLRQGIRGEREVGRMLEGTRSLGYEVFHDIPGDGFNVDHALVGPGGVFAIETKTISKPANGRAEVDYDGERVLLDGQTPDRDPIAQARASADHLRDLLKRTTGRGVSVRPVVLYPGWWVNSPPHRVDVWGAEPEEPRRRSCTPASCNARNSPFCVAACFGVSLHDGLRSDSPFAGNGVGNAIMLIGPVYEAGSSTAGSSASSSWTSSAPASDSVASSVSCAGSVGSLASGASGVPGVSAATGSFSGGGAAGVSAATGASPVEGSTGGASDFGGSSGLFFALVVFVLAIPECGRR